MFLLVLFCTPSVSNRSWLLPKRMLQDTGNTSLPVSFQQLVLPVTYERERERERERGKERGREGEGEREGGLSMEKDKT